ncbi:MAG: GTPase Era [Lachnospiraceae bacterium]|jgi:GTP-binding protein Era|nr:GTPase Era [Lachnospiraceae bacterium]
MDKFKSGFVSIIGKTNVGKSTLLNKLVGEKIAIMANKSQTTRTLIKGIVNNENSQIVFIDTPGIHKPKTKLGNIMVDSAYGTIPDADVLLFVIDAGNEKVGKAEEILLEKLKVLNKKAILIINKIDLIKKENLFKLIEIYSKEYNFEEVIPISALKKDNRELILQKIESLLPVGPAYYDIEEYTDQTLRQIAEEVIREKALYYLSEEIPHGIYVEVEKYSERKTKSNENIFDIEAVIYCARESHKGIIIGKNGEMLKRIGTATRIDLERGLMQKVNLKLWVKVSENWQEKENILKKFKAE